MDREAASGTSDSRALPLKCVIEGLLFVAEEPLKLDRLATVLDSSIDDVEHALGELAADCENRGVRLQRKGHWVQMVTAPEVAEPVRRLLGLEETSRLSPAALETLAIVAYHQPATRAQVEAVRGVNSDSVLRTLLSYGLIEGEGRLAQAGRPILYGTTFGFLQQFGLSDLDQLPSLEGWAPRSEGTEHQESGLP